MNNTTPYEQLIASKLDQVPVPDMADSIWAGIELQLAAGTGVPAKKPLPKFKEWGWYGFAVVGIVAFVVVLWLRYSHIHKTQNNVTPQTQPVIKQPPPVTDSIKFPASVNRKDVLPAPVNKRMDAVKDSTGNSRLADSFMRQRLYPLVIDTPFIPRNKMTTPPLLVDSINTRPMILKKPKGVKGIGENDYKIVTGKDSTKKVN